MDMKQRVDDLIVISGRLAELLARENEALRQRQSQVVAGLLDDKAKLSRAFETRVQGLVEQAAKIAEVDAEARDRLRTLGAKVRELMAENGRLLKVAIEAHNRVVGLIAEAVKSSAPGPKTYSASGATAPRSRGAAAQVAPVSVNRSL